MSQTRDGNLALPAGGILLSSMRQGHIFGDVSALSPWAPQTAHLTLRVRSSTEVKLLTISVEEAFHHLPSERSKAIRKLATEKAGWQQQRLAVLVQGYGPKRQAGVYRWAAEWDDGRGGSVGKGRNLKMEGGAVCAGGREEVGESEEKADISIGREE